MNVHRLIKGAESRQHVDIHVRPTPRGTVFTLSQGEKQATVLWRTPTGWMLEMGGIVLVPLPSRFQRLKQELDYLLEMEQGSLV